MSRSEAVSHEERPAEAIVQSDDSTDDESAPAPPDGYRRYSPEDEMGRWFRSDFFDVAAVFWPIAFLILMGVSYASAQIGRLPVILVLGIIAMAMHEGLHVLAGRLFGLEATVGVNFKRLNPYVLTYGGFQSRLQTAVISMAPLVVISTFCVVVIFAFALVGRSLTDVAIFGLINIVLSYYDLLDLRFTMSLPEGTKEYHRQGHDVAYYVPEGVNAPESGD